MENGTYVAVAVMCSAHRACVSLNGYSKVFEDVHLVMWKRATNYQNEKRAERVPSIITLKEVRITIYVRTELEDFFCAELAGRWTLPVAAVPLFECGIVLEDDRVSWTAPVRVVEQVPSHAKMVWGGGGSEGDV